MKTRQLITIILLFAFAPFAKSQTSEHLSFKGVPIDGKLSEFVSKMVAGGFTHKRTHDGMALLMGDFAGYVGCSVGVSSLKQKDLVSKIVVLFPEKDTWSSLAGDYFNLKQMLTEKYGEPSEVVEIFDQPDYAQPDDDNAKMYEVKFDRCKYYSIFTTDAGDIQLSIAHQDTSSCFAKLLYLDKINGEIIKAEAIEDL